MLGPDCAFAAVSVDPRSEKGPRKTIHWITVILDHYGIQEQDVKPRNGEFQALLDRLDNVLDAAPTMMLKDGGTQ